MTPKQAVDILNIYLDTQYNKVIERQRVFEAHDWLPDDYKCTEYPLSFVRKVLAIRKYCDENLQELKILSDSYYDELYNQLVEEQREKKYKWDLEQGIDWQELKKYWDEEEQINSSTKRKYDK